MIYRIKSFFGGLGDTLQFSTLPEMLTKAGHEVYLCKDAPFRNPEIKSFIWGLNPFIKGEADGEWNAGDIPGLAYSNSENDFIKNWERMHGLIPENSLPKIYYEPKKITITNSFGKRETDTCAAIELSAITLKYNTAKVLSTVKNITDKYPGLVFRQWHSNHQQNKILCFGDNIVDTSTNNKLSNLCDIIHTTPVLITLNSGTHTLAAAMRRFGNNFEHYCLIPKEDYRWIMEQKKFIFPNINYIEC